MQPILGVWIREELMWGIALKKCSLSHGFGVRERLMLGIALKERMFEAVWGAAAGPARSSAC